MAKLTEHQINEQLRTLPGWSLEGGAIAKRFTFPSFRAAIAFVNRVADLAEEANHHPGITIDYSAVTMSLSTHDEGGVTEKDIALARRINQAV